MSGCCINLQLLEGPGLSSPPSTLKAPPDFVAMQRVDLGLLCVSTWSLSPHYQTQGLPGKLQKD